MRSNAYGPPVALEGVAANKSTKDLLSRVRKAGFDRAFIEAAVLPDWWDASCEKDAALIPDVEIRIARFLHAPLGVVHDPKQKLVAPAYANAQLRKVSKINADQLGATIHSALSVAAAVLRSTRGALPPVDPPPRNPTHWHRELARGGRGVTLGTATADLWRRGIPVLHLEVLPSPRFQGLACLINGRPVVVIGHDTDVPSRLLSHLAHEAGHIVHGDCAEDAPVVDENDETLDRSQMERDADRYAVESALGESPPDAPGGAIRTDFKRLAQHASLVGRERGLEVGSLIWSWTIKTKEFGVGVQALKATYKHLGGARAIRAQFDQHVDLSAASESDRALLRCVKGDPDRNASPG